MKTSSKRRDYRKYKWKGKELAVNILLCAGVVLGLTYFFYRSVWAIIPLSAVGVWLFLRRMDGKIAEEKEQLSEQFKECILAVSSSLRAGYSVENAFVECLQDMEMMYGGDALICQELVCIRRGLHINLSLEELLTDLAMRSGCEDIGEFAKVFALAKRNGGNMEEIIRNAAGRIGKKMELRREIEMQLSGRKMELTIMKVIPFGILLYVNLGNPGYFDALYHNMSGVMIMTVCLVLYLTAVEIGEVIMQGIVKELI